MSKIIICLLWWTIMSLAIASSPRGNSLNKLEIKSVKLHVTNKTSDLNVSQEPSFETTVSNKSTVPVGPTTAKLPIVINTWNYTDANIPAWRILQQSEGGLGQTRNAVVEGITNCEKVQCEKTVGYGGTPDESGNTTLDAMVMDGATMNVGAVAGLRKVRDAIRLARYVLERTGHTLLVGSSAEDFAKAMGFQLYENLVTPELTAVWEKWRAKNCQPNFWIDVLPDPKTTCGPYEPNLSSLSSWNHPARAEFEVGEHNHDTIGMVAIDVDHQIHVGTSTNGLFYKIPGRVGDSPIAGAGGYANNEVGAAVATGDGDIMMRFLPTHLAVEFMRQGKTPKQAAEAVIERIAKHYKRFSGGIIAVNRQGEYAAVCRGWKEFPYVVNTRVETVKCKPKID